IEVVETILRKCNDIENNMDVALDSKLLYVELLKEIPSWVDCKIKKRKRVVKAIDIDFDALFKLSYEVIPKKPKVFLWIMVDDDDNKFVDLSIPQVDKECNSMTLANFEISRLGLGKSTFESDMAMA
ncbi:hypothetical protein KI387_036888, partial [Taxus chinensis]